MLAYTTDEHEPPKPFRFLYKCCSDISFRENALLYKRHLCLHQT